MSKSTEKPEKDSNNGTDETRSEVTSEVELNIISEGKLLRKLDAHLLPGLVLLYLLSFLDRSNVANARLEGLATDLNISEYILST